MLLVLSFQKPLLFLVHFLCFLLAVGDGSSQLFSHCVYYPLSQFPAMMDSYSSEPWAYINPFSSKLLWPWCLISATERQLTHSKSMYLDSTLGYQGCFIRVPQFLYLLIKMENHLYLNIC